MTSRIPALTALLALVLVSGLEAQKPAPKAPQKIDEEYTRLIKQNLQDPRITTELVDHLPASDTVPSPLKFLGRAVGAPGELTYAKDIYRYYEALAKAAPTRAKYWKVGTTEEGRDIVLLAIGDEDAIKNLDKYRDMLGELTDPRKTTEARAQQLLHTAKPIYYAISGMHSPETGGPEMLIELAYRLIVEETPFIQNIRNNVITLITPVIEVDGREKQVDTYYFNKKRAQGDARLPLMYWGKYVQHDNNRDGMGQFLKLTQAVTKETLEWHPTVIHDLHEAQTYLYASTGTGPYNNDIDPIVVSEWWMLAQNDVMEMTKRGVPGVWTYGFYDGWVPNYMFFIAHSHNSIGRFYEVQSYGPDPYDVRPGPTVTSKEWFRPNPPLPMIKWGPRNNTNIQESALLFSLSHVAKNKDLYLENYWLKNKRAVDKGKTGPTYAWVIPATQRRKADAAQAVNELRTQGLEVSRATSAFKVGTVDVKAGDYIVRGDQPFRTLADMYFSIQNYAPQNPSPYDDTGWTFQYMRDLKILPVAEKGILDQQMTMLTADAKAPGGIEGTGSVLVVDHTGDNNIVSFRFRNKDVKMLAAEDDFELGGHKFRAGAIIVPNADRATLEPMLKDLGLSAWAFSSVPNVKTHDLDIPRIGYIHSWTRTQDEGWWRAALDTFGVPYTYFADQKLREGQPAREVRRHHLPARRRQRGVAGQRHGEDRQHAAAVQEDRGVPEPRVRRFERRHPRRHGDRGAGRARAIRAGGRHAHHRRIDDDDLPGVRDHDRRHRRGAGAAVRARIDSAREDHRHEEPDRLRLRKRRPAGLLQPGAGAERGRRRLRRLRRRARRRAGDESQRRHRPERDAQRAAAADPAVRGGHERGAVRTRRAPAGRRHGADAADGAAVRDHDRRHASAGRDAVLGQPERHAAVGHAAQRPVPRQPRGGARFAARQGARRHVRDPAVLALADAGHLHARVQRDHELERSRRGQGRARRARHDRPGRRRLIGRPSASRQQ